MRKRLHGGYGIEYGEVWKEGRGDCDSWRGEYMDRYIDRYLGTKLFGYEIYSTILSERASKSIVVFMILFSFYYW